MSIDEFWQIINNAKSTARSSVESRADALSERLRQLQPASLRSFQRHYDQRLKRANTWALWGAAYVMCKGCSDDCFRYFRDWLISEGRTLYESVIKNPDSLAKLPRIDRPEDEAFGYVAQELYEGPISSRRCRDI
jgi:hypothetical protein